MCPEGVVLVEVSRQELRKFPLGHYFLKDLSGHRQPCPRCIIRCYFSVCRLSEFLDEGLDKLAGDHLPTAFQCGLSGREV